VSARCLTPPSTAVVASLPLDDNGLFVLRFDDVGVYNVDGHGVGLGALCVPTRSLAPSTRFFEARVSTDVS